MRKPRLSVEEQIQHMKDQGIRFEITSEERALNYLCNNTYYFKLKAYAKLYDKYTAPEKSNCYTNLDFAYLQDLSVIDANIRKLIMKISLDIEHYLHTALIKDFNRTDSDGYSIVDEFLSQNPEHYSSFFRSNRTGKACSNLIAKYRGDFAIWNIIEVLDFGDFQQLYAFFYSRYGEKLYGKPSGPYRYFINPSRVLRNAAAHNNCLINSIRTPYISPDRFNNNPEVSAYLGRKGIKNKTLNTNMGKPLLHDFCVMLYLYHLIAPANAQIVLFREASDLFHSRVCRHADYYVTNPVLVSAYNFMTQVIDIFTQNIQESSQN